MATDAYHSINGPPSEGRHSAQLEPKNDYAILSTSIPGEAKPPIIPRYRRIGWLLEVLCALLSLTGTVGIVIVLRICDGRALLEWPWGISLNAAVSSLAIASKMLMLLPIARSLSQLQWLWFLQAERTLFDLQRFDSASRGHLGSLKLIFALQGRRLACIGALVTVAAVLIEPFTQQSIVYPIRTVNANTSHVPRTQFYWSLGEAAVESYDSLDLAMKASIYDGIFNLKTWEGPGDGHTAQTATCSTGNCTFPVFSSLAVCSRCLDITSHLQVLGSCGVETCSYTLLNGLFLDDSEELNSWSNLSGTTTTFDDIHSSIANLSIIMAAPLETGGLAPPIAFDCALYYCVNTYNASVTNNEFYEPILSTFFPTKPMRLDGDLDTGNLTFTAPPSALGPHESPEFIIDRSSADTLSAYLGTLLAGTRMFDLASDPGSSDAIDAIYTNTFLVDQPDVAAHPLDNILQPFGDVGPVMESLAAAITSNIRYNQPTDPTFVTGTAWTQETYVHVRWIWLSLLCILQALGLAFLGATMARSRARALPAWKSSALATLFHGPIVARLSDADGDGGSDPELNVDMSRLDRLSEMEDLAKRLKVQLRKAEEGGKLMLG